MNQAAEEFEPLLGAASQRLSIDLRAALRRRPAQEAKLAGAVRVLGQYCPRLRGVLSEALEVMLTRGSYARPLFGAAARTLAASGDPRAASALADALVAEEGCELAALSAASLATDAAYRQPLAKLAGSRQAHVALAAEVARTVRGESNGAHAAAVAPMINEAHRIQLCVEVFVPLLGHARRALGMTPALAVLRDSERHLGRWLVLAELATESGDPLPLSEARSRARVGARAARPAWELVVWALSGHHGELEVRPTLELVSRLSDRPSADKDMTFLFRLAAAGVPLARPMLESFLRTNPDQDCAVRAALYLAKNYGVSRFRDQLSTLARGPRRERVRGLAAAALFDLGERELALAAARTLAASRQPATLAWAALVGVWASGGGQGPLVTDARYRSIQLGWCE